MRKKAHIAIREGEKVRNVYVMPEEKEEIRRIKEEQGLRSLRQAYEIWKEAKETLENNDENTAVFPGVLHEINPDDPDANMKYDEEIWSLNQTIRDLKNEIAILKATLKATRQMNEDLRNDLRLKKIYPTRREENPKQRTPDISEFWPQVKEEIEFLKSRKKQRETRRQ